MSEIKVDTVGPRVDNGTLTIGAAGDTVNIAGTAGTGFPAGTTINTNADNRIITGSGTAGTLNGEANLTFSDGKNLGVGTAAPNSFSGYSTVTIGGANSTSGSGLDFENNSGAVQARLFGDANGAQHGAIANGSHRFEIDGSERLRIGPAGQIGTGGANYGSSGQVLQSNGASSSVSWAAAGGGKVLQVVQQIMPSNYTMSSGTNALVSGMNPQITMASTTNKLIVLGSYALRISGNGSTVTPSANLFITDVSNVQKAGVYLYFNVASNTHHPTWTVCQQAMWTPGSTSAYDVKLLCNNASEGGSLQFYGVSGVAWTSFTLIEIEA